MKKVLTVLLSVAMLVAFVGCTASESPIAENSPTPASTPIPTPTPTPAPKDTEFYASEYIKNADLWNGERMFNDEFQFVVEYQDDCVIRDKLGVNYKVLDGDFVHNVNSTGEWGYAIMNHDGLRDGTTRYNVGPTFWEGEKPKNRFEAFNKVMNIITTFNVNDPDLEKYSCMTGHYPWQHYSGMAGFTCLGVETGEGIAATQFRVAMTRGAAKQYGTTWFVDFSQWYGGYLLDYRSGGAGYYKGNSSATGGHSLNQMERSLLLDFMGGADATIAEGGQWISYYDDGSISPYGELMQKMYKFTSEHQDMGTTYTPFAFILDKEHGMGMNSGSDVFCMFKQNDKDKFTEKILNTYIWKDALDGVYSNESYAMVNGVFGDTFDFFLQDVSAELIATYPALILTGDLQLTDEELQKYVDYVKNGGILVVNTGYATLFEGLDVEIPRKLEKEYNEELGKETYISYKEIEYGEGSFMVYGNGGMFDIIDYPDGESVMYNAKDWDIGGLYAILTELHDRYVPFNFSEYIGYTVTMKDKTIYLYVYNNEGVTKKVNEVEIIDTEMLKELDIKYTGGYVIHSAEDIYNAHEVTVEGQNIHINLEAGGIAIIELKVGKQ